MARRRICVSSSIPAHPGMPVWGKPSVMLFVISSAEFPCLSSTPTRGVPCAAPSKFAPWHTLQFSAYGAMKGSTCGCCASAAAGMSAIASIPTARDGKAFMRVMALLLQILSFVLLPPKRKNQYAGGNADFNCENPQQHWRPDYFGTFDRGCNRRKPQQSGNI